MTQSQPENRPRWLSWPLLILIMVSGIWLFQTHSSLLIDPDIYWHLSVGDWILSHGSVPTTDHFSHSMAGAPWLAHEWLSEVLFALVFRAAGWNGLVCLAILCAGLTLAYLTRFLLDRAPPLPSLLLVILAYSSLLPHLVARPHLIAWLLLVIWAGSLLRAAEESGPPPLWLLPLMVLWANLHGSFILGLALTPLLGAEAILNAGSAQRHRQIVAWTGFLGLALVCATLSPLGWKGLLFLPALANIRQLGRVGEWSPADFSSPNPLELWLILLLVLACLGYLRLPVLRLFLLLGLLHMALAHSRYIAIFGLLTPLLIARPFGNAHQERHPGRREVKHPGLGRRLAKPASLWAVPGAAVILSLMAAIASQVNHREPVAGVTPKGAVDQALARALDRGPVLNHYNFGGYLIRRGIPVFIDGRVDMYGGAHLDAYLAIQDAPSAPDLAAALEKAKVTWTLLPTGTSVVGFMDHLDGWERVYRDDVAVIHARR